MKLGDYDVQVLSNEKVKVGCVEVTRAQAEEVLRLMREWKPAPFKVGDYVRVVNHAHALLVGWVGRIRELDQEDSFIVEFANYHPAGVGISALWYMHPSCLELAP